MHGKVFRSPTPFCATRKIFSVCFSPGPLSLSLHPHSQFGLSLLSGVFLMGSRLDCEGLPKKPPAPAVGGLWDASAGIGLSLPPTSACLLLLQARFVALVWWAMPTIAAYFAVRPHTFLRLFALTVRKTWGLAQTLRLPLAATTP